MQTYPTSALQRAHGGSGQDCAVAALKLCADACSQHVDALQEQQQLSSNTTHPGAMQSTGRYNCTAALEAACRLAAELCAACRAAQQAACNERNTRARLAAIAHDLHKAQQCMFQLQREESWQHEGETSGSLAAQEHIVQQLQDQRAKAEQEAGAHAAALQEAQQLVDRCKHRLQLCQAVCAFKLHCKEQAATVWGAQEALRMCVQEHVLLAARRCEVAEQKQAACSHAIQVRANFQLHEVNNLAD